MTIDEILGLWEKDSVIDRTNISDECLNVPALHHKYLRIITNESLILKKLENDFHTLYKLKWEYYHGTIDRETLIEKEWKPFSLKILKQDIPIYMNSDQDIQNINIRISLQKEKTNILESILKTIAYRNNTMKNYIDYEKFTVGA